jgi:uncharacterized protein YcfL
MKKLLFMAIITLGVTSCASNKEVASNSHALAQREIASKVSACALESHPRNKSWYRVSLNGNPYNKHWYSKKDAMKIQNNVSRKGICK